MELFYETSKGYKFSEEDVYQEGCLPDTGSSSEVDIKFKADTPHELLEQILKFHDVQRGEIQTEACGEYGRIDVSILETVRGVKANNIDIELWKNGQQRLFSVIYTYKIYRVRRELINL